MSICSKKWSLLYAFLMIASATAYAENDGAARPWRGRHHRKAYDAQFAVGAQYLYQTGSAFFPLGEIQLSISTNVALGLIAMLGSVRGSTVKSFGASLFWYPEEVYSGLNLQLGGAYSFYGNDASGLSGSVPSARAMLGWRYLEAKDGVGVGASVGSEAFFAGSGSLGFIARIDLAIPF